MNDHAGAARAAAEPIALPQVDNPQVAPSNDTGQTSPVVDRAQETARASVDRAFATLDKQDDGGRNGEIEPGDPGRDERGRFKAREQRAEDKPVAGLEAPQGFSAEAKTAWASLPESIRTETDRALRELNDGLSKYQKLFEPLKPYQELAAKFGTTMHETLERYVALDMALLSEKPEDRKGAIERVLAHAGMTPRAYAQEIMAQKPEEGQSQGDGTITELRREIAELRNEFGGLSRSLAQRRDDELLREVNAFAEGNPRLKDAEVQGMIIRLIKGGIAPDLKQAYDLAVRLMPEPVRDTHVPAGASPETRKPPPSVRNANLSISGAPGAGSNPARRKAPQSARESVDNAFASLGIV